MQGRSLLEGTPQLIQLVWNIILRGKNLTLFSFFNLTLYFRKRLFPGEKEKANMTTTKITMEVINRLKRGMNFLIQKY